MAKMKVHELAKELGRQSKELIAFLQDKGYEVKVAQSSIEDEAIEQVRKQFGTAAKPQDDGKKAEAKAAPEAEIKAEAAEAAKPEVKEKPKASGTQNAKDPKAAAKPAKA